MATEITGGVLPDGPVTFTDEDREWWQRRRDQEAAREAAAAEYAAQLKRRAAEIDLLAGKYLSAELERVRPPVRPKHLEDFKRFREFCLRDGWPTSLPSLPQSLFGFLSTESEKGADHITKLAKSISLVHRTAGCTADPADDDLIRAYLLAVRTEEKANLEPQMKGND